MSSVQDSHLKSRFSKLFKEWLIREKDFPTLDMSLSLVVGIKPQLLQHKNHCFLFLAARYYIWTFYPIDSEE